MAFVPQPRKAFIPDRLVHLLLPIVVFFFSLAQASKQASTHTSRPGLTQVRTHTYIHSLSAFFEQFLFPHAHPPPVSSPQAFISHSTTSLSYSPRLPPPVVCFHDVGLDHNNIRLLDYLVSQLLPLPLPPPLLFSVWLAFTAIVKPAPSASASPIFIAPEVRPVHPHRHLNIPPQVHSPPKGFLAHRNSLSANQPGSLSIPSFLSLSPF